MALTENPKLALIPSGYKASKVYSVLPSDGVGDFDFSRSGNATRINKDGLIETVSSNVPRLNYPLIDGVVQGCPSLLLENSSTNYLLYSNDISGYNNFGSTDTLNVEISPDGSQNASLVNGDGNQIQIFLATQNVNLTSGGFYTISVFAKKGSNSFIQLSVDGFSGSTNDIAYFDLENGTTPTSGAKIENFGNGWYRCSTVVTIDTSDLIGRMAFRIVPSLSDFLFSSASDALDKNVYVYGFQMEQGSYPTSYIPSLTGSQTTRSAETCNNSGDVNTFNDSEGVLMAEISALVEDGDIRRMSISNGTTNQLHRLEYSSTKNVLFGVTFVSPSNQAAISTTLSDATIFSKVAYKYKNNDFALWVNGYEVGTDLNGSVPTGLSELAFDNGAGGNDFYGNTKQIQYFDTALTDTDLEELTSWTSFNEMAESQLYSIQ